MCYYYLHITKVVLFYQIRKFLSNYFIKNTKIFSKIQVYYTLLISTTLLYRKLFPFSEKLLLHLQKHYSH